MKKNTPIVVAIIILFLILAGIVVIIIQTSGMKKASSFEAGKDPCGLIAQNDSLKAVLADRDAQLLAKDQIIADKDNELAERPKTTTKTTGNADCNVYKREIDNRKADQQKKARKIAELKDRIAELENLVAELEKQLKDALANQGSNCNCDELKLTITKLEAEIKRLKGILDDADEVTLDVKFDTELTGLDEVKIFGLIVKYKDGKLTASFD